MRAFGFLTCFFDPVAIPYGEETEPNTRSRARKALRHANPSNLGPEWRAAWCRSPRLEDAILSGAVPVQNTGLILNP